MLKPYRFWIVGVVLASALAGVSACDEDNGDGNADAMGVNGDPDSAQCAENEVIVAYLASDNDREECTSLPDACMGDPCGDSTCVGALYDLCEAPATGVACSDDGVLTIVSCNG